MAQRQSFDLIETMRFDPQEEIIELDRHLDRNESSGRRPRVRFRPAAARNELQAATFGRKGRAMVGCSCRGAGHGDRSRALSSEPDGAGPRVVRAAPGRADDFRLRHKTTDRRFYDGPGKRRVVRRRSSSTRRGRHGRQPHQIFVEREAGCSPRRSRRGFSRGSCGPADRRGAAEEAELRPEDLKGGFFVGDIVRGLIAAQAGLGGDREPQQPVADRHQSLRPAPTSRTISG